jgi:hypothetical protein
MNNIDEKIVNIFEMFENNNEIKKMLNLKYLNEFPSKNFYFLIIMDIYTNIYYHKINHEMYAKYITLNIINNIKKQIKIG